MSIKREGFKGDLINLKKWFTENIGLFSPQRTGGDLLAGLSEFHSYTVTNHTDFASFLKWTATESPQLILLSAEMMDEIPLSDLDRLRQTVLERDLPSLVLCQSVDQIRRWRQTGWPHLHFYYGPVGTSDLQEKVMNIMNERYMVHQPCVVLFSEKPFVISHLSMLLSPYGLRLRVIPDGNGKIGHEPVICEHPEAIIWDTAFLTEKGSLIFDEIQRYQKENSYDLPSFFISDQEEGVSHSPKSYSLKHSHQLIRELLNTMTSRRQKKFRVMRDSRTGLFLKETFVEVVKREIAAARRRDEEFSILKLALTSMDGHKETFGEIFADGLEMNLGFFIQNRIRASDFVARGGEGEILVLLPRVGKKAATLVGERLCHRFAREASFGEKGQLNFFAPRLVYQIYCFPHDIENHDHLKEAMNGTGQFADEARGQKPEVSSQ